MIDHFGVNLCCWCNFGTEVDVTFYMSSDRSGSCREECREAHDRYYRELFHNNEQAASCYWETWAFQEILLSWSWGQKLSYLFMVTRICFNSEFIWPGLHRAPYMARWASLCTFIKALNKRVWCGQWCKQVSKLGHCPLPGKWKWNMSHVNYTIWYTKDGQRTEII